MDFVNREQQAGTVTVQQADQVGDALAQPGLVFRRELGGDPEPGGLEPGDDAVGPARPAIGFRR
ncbi:hypothetical protein [Arthrobacter ginkgonis]|uniref:hypothetical protein n=1 Tax=Arthrobacter ginkgonis TaxID=1630594 RepID=UPI0031ED7A76